MAPDFVLEIRASDSVSWECSNVPSSISEALGAGQAPDDGGLLSALGAGCPNDLGRIPGFRLNAPPGETAEQIAKLWEILDNQSSSAGKSEARNALDSRRTRMPGDVAGKLVEHYGDTLDPVIYTQGVSISGRLRYGALDGATDDFADGVARLVEPHLSGDRPWFGDSDGGANYAGIVWCDEMYDATGDSRYRDLLISIADRFKGGDIGLPPPPCDPDYRTEDMFFAGALLGRASLSRTTLAI